jgi:hypothetical protein
MQPVIYRRFGNENGDHVLETTINPEFVTDNGFTSAAFRSTQLVFTLRVLTRRGMIESVVTMAIVLLWCIASMEIYKNVRN